MSARYWIVVASRDHVECGVEGEFAQACHGKASPLRRMHKDDGIIYYSSKIVFGQDEKCQCFTAIGTVADDTVVQADMGEGFLPFRRHVRFFACQETPIAPLIPHLSFIKDKHHWAGVFRFGLVEIPETDYLLIANHMGVQSPASVA